MISTIIITKNEEVFIAACIDSVSFTDEIIIIDNGSKDNTVEIARKHNARVVIMSEEDDFAKLRNRGVEEAQNDWVLFIDADEIVSKKLQKSIKKEMKNPKYFSYYIKRRDHWWGRTLRFGEVESAYFRGFIRLIKKESGTWKGAVHEMFQTIQKSGYLDGYIEHYPHTTLSEFISDINYYSTLKAEELHHKRKKVHSFEIIIIPFLKFLYTYVVLLGFLDGPAGFVYSFIMSFHSFLVRAKLYIMRS